MFVMHHAFRRDLTLFRAVVGSVDLADHPRWRARHERWQLFASVLHRHPVADDTGLPPLLLERAQAQADDGAREVLEAMVDEHALVDPSLEACAEAFASMAASPDAGVRSGLVRSLDEVWRLLDGHLGHEERDAMALERRPIVQHHVERSADTAGSRREVASEIQVDLGGRIKHSWVSAGVSTLARRPIPRTHTRSGLSGRAVPGGR